MSEDDWECDACKHINKMDIKDRYSSYCKKCNARNQVVYEMIKYAQSSQYSQAE